MVAISQQRVLWSGQGVVGGGVSTFYTEGPALTLHNAVVALFSSTVQGLVPNSVTFTIPNSGDVLASDTGELLSVWSEGVQWSQTGTVAGGQYAAGVGARLLWDTAQRTNNRRVRGSTYLAPLAVGAYQSDGTIVDSTRTALSAAAHAMLVAVGNDLLVWTRPKGGLGGRANTVIEGSCSDKVTWLRSRRT